MTKDVQNKKPAYTAYIVPDREDAPWIPVGAVWQHKDGEGYSIRLDLMPPAGTRLILRKPKAKSEEDAFE